MALTDCPICGAAAKEDDKVSVYRAFHCPSCGDFNISDTVYDTGMLQKLDPDQRRGVLEKAKRAAKQGDAPKITSYTF